MSDVPIERLTWIPLLIDRLEESGAWDELQDFQFGWYIKLLIRSTRSARRGYLRLDGQLWRSAGARRPEYFEQHKEAVLARFRIRQFDGQDWIYSPTMLSVLEDQSTKYRRSFPQKSQAKTVDGGRAAPSVSSSDSQFLRKEPAAARAYSQRDFDERDTRKLTAELEKLYRTHQGNITREHPTAEGRFSERMLFELACQRAGITLERGREILGEDPSAASERSARN